MVRAFVNFDWTRENITICVERNIKSINTVRNYFVVKSEYPTKYEEYTFSFGSWNTSYDLCEKARRYFYDATSCLLVDMQLVVNGEDSTWYTCDVIEQF